MINAAFSINPWSRQLVLTPTMSRDSNISQSLPSWEQFPVLFTESEMETMNIAHVKYIIEGYSLLPSEGAGLKGKLLCETAKKINSLYEEKIKQYKQGLLEASLRDKKEIEQLKTSYCLNRKAQLKVIDILEKARLEESHQILFNRCQILHNKIKSSEENRLSFSVDTDEKLEALCKIYRYLFKQEINLETALNADNLSESVENQDGNFKEFNAYLKKSKLGDAKSQYNVAWCYSQELGVDFDESQLLYYYKQAAKQGIVQALYNIGCYYDSIGNHDEAYRWYYQAAEKGLTSAQYMIGYYLELGIAVNQDHIEAVKWYQKAKDQNHAPAEYALALAYQEGRGTDRNLREAYHLFLNSAQNDYIPAQFALGYCYKQGKGVIKDLDRGLELCSEARKKGYYAPAPKLEKLIPYTKINDDQEILSEDSDQDLSLVEISNYNEVQHPLAEQEDIEKEDKECKSVCEDSPSELKKLIEEERIIDDSNSSQNNDLTKQYELAQQLEKEDKVAAATLYLALAVQGHIPAKLKMAHFYLNGIGISQNEKQAAEYYFEAADQEDKEAQYQVSQFYLSDNNTVVAKDEQEFIRLCESAARQEYLPAILALANYWQGQQNSSKSIEWYKRGAELGSAQAQFQLGIQGKDLIEKEDRIKNLKQSIIQRENGEDNLTAEQIQQAEKFIRQIACVIL